MEPVSDERTASQAEERPAFDELEPPEKLLRSGRTRDQIYTTLLQLHDPATVSEIADRSDCGPDAAREYLQWFADMGLARRSGDTPATYVVNAEYLHWRRANRLSQTAHAEELVTRLQDVLDGLAEYRERYDADSPGAVTIPDAAARRAESLDVVWQDLSNWRTELQRRDTLELALDMRRGRSPGHSQFTSWPDGDLDPLAGDL